MTKIYLSPSSQWGNTYSYGGYNEAQVCGMIAKYAGIALTRNGYEVKVGDNVHKDMVARVAESDAWGADYHVPVHTNAGGGQGTVVFASTKNQNNKYVKAVYVALAEVSPGVDRNVRVHDSLYEIYEPGAITIYTETEFHDHPQYSKWIVENVEAIGEAIAKGFCTADGKPYIAKGTASSTTTTTAPKKSLEEIATLVLRGDYGNGEPRRVRLEAEGYNYDEVQAKVQELKKKTTNLTFVPYLIKKDCDVLNIRSGPGTNYPRVGEINDENDYKYTIIEEKAGPGSDKGWGRLKSKAGWIALDWVKRV